MSSFRLEARYEGFALAATAEWEASSCALFGASGSGKTTVIEALVGCRPEVSGTAVLAGRRLDGLGVAERRLGWVPQDAALFPHMTARENLDFAARARGSPEALESAVGALEIGGLLERRAHELSGGERQRVAIARALASRPDFLLLDEPLASVDRPLRSRILPFLQDLPARTGVPLFVVTHDPLEVLAVAQHVLVLEAGRIVAAGDPRGVFASASTFGALFAFGAENRFDVTVVERGAGTLLVETTGGCRLFLADVAGFPEPRRVAVRAEDVLLAREPGRTSAQNVFPGRVEALEPVGEQVFVELAAAGERWRVRVTERAVASLGIAPGEEFTLLVKAHAVLPV